MNSLKIAALCSLLSLAAGRLWAAEFRFVPSVGMSEDYTDNVDETATGRHSDLVTRVQPGGALKWDSNWSVIEAAYNLDYRYHSFSNIRDGVTHSLGVVGAFTPVEDFFKLDLTDTFRRISLDVARDTTSESLFVNQTDVNTLFVSPYLLWQLGPKGGLKTGASYTDVRYWTPLGIDHRQESVFAQLTHELTPRLSLTAGSSFNLIQTELLHYRQSDLSAGLRYEYAANSFLFGSIGNSWQHFSTGSSPNHLFWDIGLIRDFGSLVATLESLVRYSDDPMSVSLRQTSHSAKLEMVMPRSTIGVSAARNDYSDTLGGGNSRHGTTIAVSGTREVGPKVTASLTVAGDKLSRSSVLDYPYHLTATATLGYAMNYGVTLGLAYTYATYRYHLDQGRDAVEINRVVLQLRKAF